MTLTVVVYIVIHMMTTKTIARRVQEIADTSDARVNLIAVTAQRSANTVDTETIRNADLKELGKRLASTAEACHKILGSMSDADRLLFAEAARNALLTIRNR